MLISSRFSKKNIKKWLSYQHNIRKILKKKKNIFEIFFLTCYFISSTVRYQPSHIHLKNCTIWYVPSSLESYAYGWAKLYQISFPTYAKKFLINWRKKKTLWVLDPFFVISNNELMLLNIQNADGFKKIKEKGKKNAQMKIQNFLRCTWSIQLLNFIPLLLKPKYKKIITFFFLTYKRASIQMWITKNETTSCSVNEICTCHLQFWCTG